MAGAPLRQLIVAFEVRSLAEALVKCGIAAAVYAEAFVGK
jgi:hypothetical protein